jgi:hypothetical protein
MLRMLGHRGYEAHAAHARSQQCTEAARPMGISMGISSGISRRRYDTCTDRFAEGS